MGEKHEYGKTWGGRADDQSAEVRQKHTAETVPGSGMSQVVDAIRNAGHGFVFRVEHPFGRTTTQRRIAKRLHKVRWALEFRELQVAPAQQQALAMLYGCEMPPSECARRLGISAQAFHERLVRGERRVDGLYDGRIPVRDRKGRPNAKLNAPEGAEWMYLRARESLGPGATFIWGEDLNPAHDAEFERILEEAGLTVEDIRKGYEERDGLEP